MGNQLNENATKFEVHNLQCVDLSNPDIHQSVAQIKQACLDSGIFYVINHGISVELMDEALDQNKKFFRVPMDEKMKLFRGTSSYGGYLPPRQEYKAETYGQSARELDDDPTNEWPPEDIFPGWKVTMGRFQRETFNLGRAIARLMAQALDLDIDFFNQPDILGVANTSLFNILHYKAPETDIEEDGVAHTDFSLLTLLATDDVLGLQICRDRHAKPQTWEYVLPTKGAFIVHVGDVLEGLSNGNFKSILHKVVHRQERYSISFFLVPSLDYVIECLPTQKSEENPPKFSPIKVKDFHRFYYSRYEALATGD